MDKSLFDSFRLCKDFSMCFLNCEYTQSMPVKGVYKNFVHFRIFFFWPYNKLLVIVNPPKRLLHDVRYLNRPERAFFVVLSYGQSCVKENHNLAAA